MSGALVLALPGLLCAVMAWDLSRPAADRGSAVDLRQLAVAVVLAAGAGFALAPTVLLPLGAPPPAALPAGVTGAVALICTPRPTAIRPAAIGPGGRSASPGGRHYTAHSLEEPA